MESEANATSAESAAIAKSAESTESAAGAESAGGSVEKTAKKESPNGDSHLTVVFISAYITFHNIGISSVFY